MAQINLISEPDEFNEVGGCIKWELSMTGVFENDTENRLVYWLEANGGKITYEDQVIPAEGKVFPIDFSGELRKKVFTQPPNFDAPYTAITIEDSMLLEFSLHFKIVTFNKLTCESTEGPIEKLGPYKAINVASNWYKPFLLNNNDAFLINYKPEKIEVANNSEDFIYVWGKATIHFEFYNGSGVSFGDYQIDIGADGKISSIPCGPRNLNTPQGCASYVMSVIGQSTTSRVHYLINCNDNHTDLYFFDGGYSGISMNIVQRGITDSHQIINQHNSNCSLFSPQNLRTKGPSLNNKVAYDVINLEKVLDTESERDLEFYRRMKISGNYYIKTPFYFDFGLDQGRAIKFTPTSNQIIYDRPDGFPVLQIQGQINVPYRQANYHI